MLNSLIKIIQNTEIDEETAIEQVNLCLSEERDILTVDLDLSIPAPSTTPLIEAAKRGFIKLSERLISAGFSADEMSQQQLSPLAVAISAKQTETAAYLLSQTKNVTPSLLGRTLLHDLVENDLLGMLALPLLSLHPKLLNQQSLEGETALLLAARHGDLEAVQRLCALGANPHIACIDGITPTTVAAINGHPAVLAFLQDQMGTCPISVDSIADQHHMLFMMLRNVKNDKKIKCLKQMIQAGAGLSPALLSDETLSLLKLKRSQLGDFLMLVTEKLPNQNTKEYFICTEQQLITVLNSSNKTVDIEKLIRACQHPLLRTNDKVQRIDALLKRHASEVISIEPPFLLPHEEDQPAILDVDDMKTLDESVLTKFLSHRLNLLDKISNIILRKLSYLNKGFTLCAPNAPDIGLEKVLSQWLHVLHELVQTAHHPFTRTVTFNSEAFLTILHQEFDKIYNPLLMLFNHADAGDTIVKFANLLDEKLRALLKENSGILKFSNIGLYNSLWDGQALLTVKLARWHLDEGKLNEALTLALESLEFNDQMLINNPMLEMSAGHTKGLCLSTSAYVFIHHGWTSKAAKQLHQAIPLHARANMYDPLLVESCQILATRFAEQQKFSKASALLQSLQQYLKELKVSSPVHQELIRTNKPAISKQLERISEQSIAHKLQLTKTIFSSEGSVSRQRNEIIFHYNASCLHADNTKAFHAFISENQFTVQKNKRHIKITVNQFMASEFLQQLEALVSILKTPLTPTQTLDTELKPELLEQLSMLLISGSEVNAAPVENQLSDNKILFLNAEVTESKASSSMSNAIEESLFFENDQSHSSPIKTVTTRLVIEDDYDEYPLSHPSCSDSKDENDSEDESNSEEVSDKSENVLLKEKTFKKSKAFPSESSSERETPETYGFTPIPGFTRIVPITSGRLPKHTLFMTMSDTEEFAPFYKLMCDKNREKFYEVPEIPPKGFNKQGIKLSTLSIKTGKRREKIACGRLKVLGSQGTGKSRAQGFVEQTITLPDGKQRKLYVFRQAEPKKVEKRKNYRF